MPVALTPLDPGRTGTESNRRTTCKGTKGSWNEGKSMSERRLAKTAPLLFTLAGLSSQADAQSCNIGEYWDGHNCQPCAVGTYNPFATSSSSPLPAGSSSPVATACQTAPSGFYVPTTGASAALSCPVGSSSTAGASACSPLPATAPVPALPGIWAGLLALFMGALGWLSRRFR